MDDPPTAGPLTACSQSTAVDVETSIEIDCPRAVVAAQELTEKFAEWSAMMGIERQPTLSITQQSYEETDNKPEMHFTTMVDDIPLRGRYTRGEKLRMMHGDDAREINSLADLGRAVRAEDRQVDGVHDVDDCAISECDNEATTIVTLPAVPLEWQYGVCDLHSKMLQNSSTKINYLDDGTIAVVDESASDGD